ncbi:hypothetical protein P261_00976 [Lachnospiraceae bacterium TWA4]|nr:hypothetical protein P261_00976 [Lachnospiraceae bacterium TWA4]
MVCMYDTFCYIIFPYLYHLFYDENGEYKKYSWLKFIVLISFIVVYTVVLKHRYTDLYKNIEIALTRLPIFIVGVYLAKPIKSKKEVSLGYGVLAVITIGFASYLYWNRIATGIYERYLGSFVSILLILILSLLFSKLSLKGIHQFFVGLEISHWNFI